MSDRLEDRWVQTDAIRSYDFYREMFREASADLIRKVFAQYVEEEDRIIEIGCGLGELVKLVPEFKEKIQQTDQSPEMVAENLATNPDSNVRVANVYDLPFSEGSFDVAVGYSSFDCLADLPAAFSELSRVLTPNGKIVHLLDIQASPNTVFHRYESQNVALFPLCELDKTNKLMYFTGVQLVREKDMTQVRDKFIEFNPKLAKWFDYYVGNQELMFTLVGNNPDYSEMVVMVSHFVKESGVDAEPIRFNEDFQEHFEQALGKTGYDIVESGKKDGIAVVKRNGRHIERPKVNLFHNDAGGDRSTFDPSLVSEIGQDEVKVISTQYVAVGKKA